MQKRYIFCVFIALFLSVSFSPVRAQRGAATASGSGNGPGNDTIGAMLSLPQAVSVAIKNNLLVNQSDLTMQQNRISYNQAWDNLLPTLNASAGQTMGFGRTLNTYNYTYVNQQTNSGNYNVNTNLTLFNGFYLQNSIRQGRYAYDASKMDLQNQKDQITLSIILDYLLILSAQDQLALTREQADVDSKQLARLDALNKEGGLLVLSDLSNLQGQYATDVAGIATAESSLELAKVNLFQILNVPYKRDVEFDRGALAMQLTDYLESPDSIYRTALQIIPAIKAADLRVKSYERALAAQRGLYYPTLSFGAGVNTYYNNNTSVTTSTPSTVTDVPTTNFVTVGGTDYNVINKQQNYITTTQNTSFGDQFKNNRSESLGLTLSIPILNFFRTRNNVKQAKVLLKNYEYVATNTKLALQQNVEQAYQYMILAYKQYKSYIDQAAAYAEAFRITETRFNEGVIGVNADTYVLAKNKTDAANLALAQAKYTYIFRTKVLDYYQGRLTP